MKTHLHLTFQNTIPENSLRRTQTPFIEFSKITNELFITKDEFIKTYAIYLQEMMRSNLCKISSFQHVLNFLDRFFMIHFQEVINFPIKYDTKTYLVNWNKISRDCVETTQMRYTEVERVCIEIPNDQCCKNTCNAFEVSIELWDKVQTTIRQIQFNKLKQLEFFLIEEFNQFGRFPVTTEHFIFKDNCLKPLLDVYNEDEISEFLDIRKSGCNGDGLFLMAFQEYPKRNKTICVWAPMKITREVNPCGVGCSLEYMVTYNNEIKSCLLLDCDFNCEENPILNYIIYISLTMGISSDYNINP